MLWLWCLCYNQVMGGITGNFPASRIGEATMASFIESGLSAFSCCRNRGSSLFSKPGLQSSSNAGSGMETKILH